MFCASPFYITYPDVVHFTPASRVLSLYFINDYPDFLASYILKLADL